MTFKIQLRNQFFLSEKSDHITSPAIHILTNITKDTITIVNISDECAYEPRPFDMNVGFLFTYCDELSENPEVVTTQVFDDKMECGTIEYAEYISERL